MFSKNIETKKGYYTQEGFDEPIEFSFKNGLSMYAQANLVSQTVNALTNSDSKTYYPGLKDLFFKFYLIQALTDIDVDHIINVDDLPIANRMEYQIDEMEKLAEQSNVCAILIADTNISLLVEQLYSDLNKALTFRTGIHEDYNNIIHSVQKLLNLFISQVETTDMDALIGAAKGLSGIKGFGADEIIKAFQNTEDYKNSQEIIDDKNKTILDLKSKIEEQDESQEDTTE